jgi:hypothetical protein
MFSSKSKNATPIAICEIASDGVVLPVDALAPVLTFNADGTIATETVAYLGNSYVRTYHYNSDEQFTNYTAAANGSCWIKA